MFKFAKWICNPHRRQVKMKINGLDTYIANYALLTIQTAILQIQLGDTKYRKRKWVCSYQLPFGSLANTFMCVHMLSE